MTHTAPDNKKATQELEFDEAKKGGECEEAKCLELKKEHQEETIEISSDEEEEECGEAHHREHMHPS